MAVCMEDITPTCAITIEGTIINQINKLNCTGITISSDSRLIS